MFPGEKSSLYRFLFIYITSSLLLLAIGLSIFFSYEKHHLIDQQNDLLKAKSSTLISELKELHNMQGYKLTYPQYKEFHSAIYDIDANYIFGDFHPQAPYLHREFYQKESMLFYVQSVFPYYLGATYIVIKKAIDYGPIDSLKTRLMIAFSVAVFLISLIAYWLGKIFLSPMRQSITLLDDFIKDTTHELNTPVSTILANAEMLKNFHPELENSKELRRIETASKRLSRIYDDLAYIHLNHQRHHNIQRLNISEFLKERINYFKSIADAKGIHFTHDIGDDIMLEIDIEDITRIIDNLLGNALKYTMHNGRVQVILDKENLCVQDSGIGIDADAKKDVLQRFVRANKSEGGFGLGLSIVGDIANYYNFDIELESELNIGTKVCILWKK